MKPKKQPAESYKSEIIGEILKEQNEIAVGDFLSHSKEMKDPFTELDKIMLNTLKMDNINQATEIEQLKAELKASRSSERESFEKSQTHIKNQEDLIDTILNQRTSDKENILNLNGQISELKEELRKRDQEVERLKGNIPDEFNTIDEFTDYLKDQNIAVHKENEIIRGKVKEAHDFGYNNGFGDASEVPISITESFKAWSKINNL